MSENQPVAMKALKAVYAEARQGRETAERLTPLLVLLDSPEKGEGSPLDPITDLLEALVRNQHSLLGAIEVLSGKVDGLAAKLR